MQNRNLCTQSGNLQSFLLIYTADSLYRRLFNRYTTLELYVFPSDSIFNGVLAAFAVSPSGFLKLGLHAALYIYVAVAASGCWSWWSRRTVSTAAQVHGVAFVCAPEAISCIRRHLLVVWNRAAADRSELENEEATGKLAVVNQCVSRSHRLTLLNARVTLRYAAPKHGWLYRPYASSEISR